MLSAESRRLVKWSSSRVDSGRRDWLEPSRCLAKSSRFLVRGPGRGEIDGWGDWPAKSSEAAGENWSEPMPIRLGLAGMIFMLVGITRACSVGDEEWITIAQRLGTEGFFREQLQPIGIGLFISGIKQRENELRMCEEERKVCRER
jgi:hypothetical protein